MGVSIDTGGKGGKKPLDAELNLVPFIDLLVCCICFLLITAVWTQMARIKVSQKSKSTAADQQDLQKPQVKLTILVGDDGYTITTGAERIFVAKQGQVYDTAKLAQHLREVKTRMPEKNDLTVAIEDGVKYMYIIGAMDVALQQHFTEIKVSDSTAAL